MPRFFSSSLYYFTSSNCVVYIRTVFFVQFWFRALLIAIWFIHSLIPFNWFVTIYAIIIIIYNNNDDDYNISLLLLLFFIAIVVVLAVVYYHHHHHQHLLDDDDDNNYISSSSLLQQNHIFSMKTKKKFNQIKWKTKRKEKNSSKTSTTTSNECVCVCVIHHSIIINQQPREREEKKLFFAN